MRVLVTGGSGFIGTNFTRLLDEMKVEFLNLDMVPPKIPALARYWTKCDILDYSFLLQQFNLFRPTEVVHLAAETDTNPSLKLSDYKVNIEGTQNVIKALKANDGVRRFVLTSTQFVNQRTGGPLHDEDYAPHTVYGESKIENERQTRNAGLSVSWTIIRPTNIWGPWHLRYPYEFWKLLAEGKYVHPGRRPVIRSYGYVGNVVSQIVRVLTLPETAVDGKVYYVGDRPIDLYEWVNGFSLGQTGRKVVIVPRILVLLLAGFGEFLRAIGLKFPITLSRFRSMTTDNPVNMEKTITELGQCKYTLQEGIDETINWMIEKHPHLITKKGNR